MKNEERNIPEPIPIHGFVCRFSIEPWNIDTLSYYEDLVIDINLLFKLLVMSYSGYFMNCGKRALLPIEKYVKKNESKKWTEILAQV